MKKLTILFVTLFSIFTVHLNAGIVHVDLSPDSIVELIIDPTFGTGSGSNLSTLDFNNDGTIDLDFRYNVSPGFGWFLHAVEQNNTALIKSNTTSTTISNPLLSVLQMNDYIGSNQNWTSNDEPLVGDTSAVNFGGQGDRYIGVRFEISGNTHYGWVLINFDHLVSPKKALIKEFGYNDVADSPISAGQTSGPPPVPEIEVTVQMTDYANNSTYDFGTSNVGVAVNSNFMIKNTGTTNLLIENLAIGGLNTADYAIVSISDTVIPSNDSATLVISFTPSTTGTRTATLNFNTNDSDEDPYLINLTGEGQTGGGGGIDSTDYEVTQNGSLIPNQTGNYDFGIVQVGSSSTVDFYIHNLDSVNDLTINDFQIFSFGGGNVFTSNLTAPFTILAHDSLLMQITFSPQFNGIESAGVIIGDFFSGAFYQFNISGEGTGGSAQPSLIVTESSVQYTNQDTFNFGSVPVGSTVMKDFVIKTSGLTQAVSIDFVDIFSMTGGNEFTSNFTSPVSLNPNDSLILTISYMPNSTTFHDAVLFIQPDFNSGLQFFELQLQGEGVNAILMTSLDAYAQGNATEINTLGGTLQMLVDILPVNATNQNVNWSVDNSSIATISQSGVLQAEANGLVTVTATATDGSGLSDDVIIEVKNQESALHQLNVGQISIYPNPTSGQIYLKNLQDIDVYYTELHAPDGRLLRRFIGLPNSFEISEYTSGVYSISIITYNRDQFVYRFVKK